MGENGISMPDFGIIHSTKERSRGAVGTAPGVAERRWRSPAWAIYPVRPSRCKQAGDGQCLTKIPNNTNPISADIGRRIGKIAARRGQTTTARGTQTSVPRGTVHLAASRFMTCAPSWLSVDVITAAAIACWASTTLSRSTSEG